MLLILLLGITVVYTGIEIARNSAVEKIPARDRSLALNVNTNAVLDDIHHGRPYDPQIIAVEPGPESLWRLVTHRRNSERPRRFPYRDDLL